MRTGVISGSKSIEYVLIPRDGGKYVLPSVDFVYFDLASKELKTIKTEEIPLTISDVSYNEGATEMKLKTLISSRGILIWMILLQPIRPCGL
ncbi:MAG: BatD family protein [Ignavibacteriales bacterium]|nr:BatD family protein [Ignavibacteriales bacterium]